MSIKIIAELAQGFEGRPEQARLLLKAAASAGADAAKFQVIYSDELATPDYKYYELFRSLEMGDEVWHGLAIYAGELGIELLVDIFGVRSLALAEKIGVAAIKLHGTDIANLGLLNAVAASSVPRVLLGAGGAYSAELDRAINILSEKEVTVLLGFQGYPTPNIANQIDRVRYLSERYVVAHPNVVLGFADHAPTDNLLSHALAAVAIGAGAKVIEKHLTLSQVMKMEDHESALNPDEFRVFGEVIRYCAEALGTCTDEDGFGMADSELDYRRNIRRHVVSGVAMKQGTVVAAANLVLKRTSAVDALTDLSVAYDRTLVRDIEVNAPLIESYFE